MRLWRHGLSLLSKLPILCLRLRRTTLLLFFRLLSGSIEKMTLFVRYLLLVLLSMEMRSGATKILQRDPTDLAISIVELELAIPQMREEVTALSHHERYVENHILSGRATQSLVADLETRTTKVLARHKGLQAVAKSLEHAVPSLSEKDIERVRRISQGLAGISNDLSALISIETKPEEEEGDTEADGQEEEEEGGIL